MTAFVSNQQIVVAARRNLTQAAWDYLVGGADSETTLRRNRLAFDRVAFEPRILVDVSNVDPSTTLLGTKLLIPVILAPIGSMQQLAADGAIASARGASDFGTILTLGQTTQPPLEDVAASCDGAKVFQMYVMGDLAWAEALLGRVRKAGFTALCVNVDTPYHSHRDRSLLNSPEAPRRGEGARAGPNYLASLTWDTLDRIREMAGLPFILKGVTSAKDAAIAVGRGIETIWVSNHGGRQLDHARGTLDVLPEIVRAVGGRAKIILDGGIQRGSDVVKALALGGDAVAIGKLQGWGAAAAGAEGVTRVLEILESEMRMTMALLGVRSVDQLSPEYVCAAEPVTPPHEMSAWVNLPEGRLL